jgi:hypothetical protein
VYHFFLKKIESTQVSVCASLRKYLFARNKVYHFCFFKVSAVVTVCSKCIRTLIYESICLIELRAEEGSISHWLEHVLPDDVTRMRRDMQVPKKKNVKKRMYTPSPTF